MRMDLLKTMKAVVGILVVSFVIWGYQSLPVSRTLAAEEKNLSQEVEVNMDGVILVNVKGPETLFVNIIDTSNNKIVVRQKVLKSGSISKLKGFTPGTYTVKSESYDGVSKLSQFTIGYNVTITKAMLMPQTPENLFISAMKNGEYNVLTASVDLIPGEETTVNFKLYDPLGELVKEANGNKLKDEIIYKFRLKETDVIQGVYTIKAHAIKYGNLSSTVKQNIKASDIKAPQPVTPVISNLRINPKGYCEFDFSSKSKLNTMYVYDSNNKQVQRSIVKPAVGVTAEFIPGTYSIYIEAKDDEFNTLKRSTAAICKITAKHALPPTPGLVNSKVSVGVFKDNNDDVVSFQTAVPYYSDEGKYFVQIIAPNGKEIGKGYTHKSNETAEVRIDVELAKLTISGQYTFVIKGEKFKSQSNAYTTKVSLKMPLPDLFWTAKSQN
ncbi:hypothetical protein [Paenibacillus sp. Leaf72]|uniref:hypothetical protein n=1 Tax=Paenibacillus sp. Leaf72 TaxID=1736234 RepID=UPI0006F50384|nr:hypothetical protein [Paenibacillus sp. Leaf72]KQN96992.1 hypothetical protein ASF12_23270 [Paenibacillus sp. Leaf72]